MCRCSRFGQKLHSLKPNVILESHPIFFGRDIRILAACLAIDAFLNERPQLVKILLFLQQSDTGVDERIGRLELTGGKLLIDEQS